KRHVHREHQVQIGGRMQEGRVNAGEGAATGEDVGDYKSEVRESLRIAHDGGIAASLGQCSEGAVQQGLPVEIQEGFVGTHTGAFASCDHKAHTRYFTLLVHANIRRA